MSECGLASEKEKEGQYREAATLYARSAFAGLVDCNFMPERKMRINVAKLLMAISCDIQADNHHRARRFFDIVELLLQEIAENADSQVLVGLTKEWTGDALLMLGSMDAVESYQEANEYYNDLEWGERSWGHEQEFDYASFALESFLSAHGIEVPKESNLPLKFPERIEFKIETAKRLLEE